MTDVYFLPARHTDGPYTLGGKFDRLYARLRLETRLPRGAMVAIKIHIGEGARPAPLPAAWLRPVVDRLARGGATPFLTDSCTLYRGARSNAVSHLRAALERGFTLTEAGAPFLIADGLLGESAVEVPIAGQHFQTVEVAGMAARATGLVVISHFTGHMGTSFGAAIKNLGMGLAPRAGKLRQHAVAKPRIEKEICSGCGICQEVCPAEAIKIHSGHAEIIPDQCTGCGQCITVCYLEGIKADYSANTRLLQERIAEHALGVVTGKTEYCVYLTSLLRVTRNCDCIGQAEPPLFDDIGILAGTDPVAIDQAAFDLVAEQTGKSIQEWCERDLNPTWQLAHGEAIGLGSRQYRLTTLPNESDENWH
jgi:uncharacterized Fe-S center protein